MLTLDATVEEGWLVLTKAMIATAESDGDCWYIRHGGLVFRFGLAGGEPAFGPNGYFTHNPEALEDNVRASRDRDRRRDAKRLEREGR